MNWDEIEDLGMICTKDWNKNSKTQYGYYTEWWFNYGWSVGGNCLEDLSGNGEWTLALQSDTPNYIVNEGKTYTGIYTGTVYTAGQTLDLKDVIAANGGDDIGYKTDGKSYFHYTVNGAEAGARDFSAQISDGTLSRLPSTKEAFSRFAYLAGIGGLNVCPYPSAFNGTSSVTYFTSGTFFADGKNRATQALVADKPEGPYRVFGQPLTPVGDGEIAIIPLKEDLSAPDGEPTVLFKASESGWAEEITPGNLRGIVTDGPWLVRENDKLTMFWSSFYQGEYAVGMLESETASVFGPWKHADKMLSVA